MDNKRCPKGWAKNGFNIVEQIFANKECLDYLECLDCLAAIHSPRLIGFYLDHNSTRPNLLLKPFTTIQNDTNTSLQLRFD